MMSLLLAIVVLSTDGLHPITLWNVNLYVAQEPKLPYMSVELGEDGTLLTSNSSEVDDAWLGRILANKQLGIKHDFCISVERRNVSILAVFKTMARLKQVPKADRPARVYLQLVR